MESFAHKENFLLASVPIVYEWVMKICCNKYADLAQNILFWSGSLKEQLKIDINILFTKNFLQKIKNSWNSSIFSKINVLEVHSCVRSPLL